MGSRVWDFPDISLRWIAASTRPVLILDLGIRKPKCITGVWMLYRNLNSVRHSQRNLLCFLMMRKSNVPLRHADFLLEQDSEYYVSGLGCRSDQLALEFKLRRKLISSPPRVHFWSIFPPLYITVEIEVKNRVSSISNECNKLADVLLASGGELSFVW